MKQIQIFKDKELKVDLPTFIDSRALICANSGGGKSYAVRKILEEANDKVLCIVLDIEGEFRTLREKYDFLLIGDEGDVPLNIKSAKLLPEKIVSLDISTIIDISDLKKSERIRYVKDFLESLMQLKRKEGMWKPCLVVLDEVHQLAGQQERQDSCPSVIDLATRGRKRGYCLVACTQRIAKLHKDVVAELNNYMVGRTGLDIDMKRASEILGFTSKKDLLSLRDLEAGEFYVFGTAISRAVIKAKVDEVKTTHPKVGMDLRKEVIPPTDKIKNMLTKLAGLPQEQEKKLKEVQDYKKEINQLKRELKIAQNGKPIIDEKSIERAKELGYNICKKEMSNENSFYRKENENLQILMNKIGSLLQMKPIPKKEFNYERKVSSERIDGFKHNNKKHQTQVSNPAPSTNGEKLRAGAMKMLNWLAGAYPEKLTKQRLATLSGFSVKGGTFNTYISELKRNDWIEGNHNLIATEEGIQNAEPQEIPNGEELLNLWKSKFRAGAGLILETLYRNYPDSMSKEELGIETNFEHTGGTFNTYMSELRRNGLIKINSGEIKISEEFYE